LRPILAMSTPSITIAPPHSSCSLRMHAQHRHQQHPKYLL
jgi:hypothetical protein